MLIKLKDAAYLDELTSTQKANTNFKMIASMTDIKGSKGWEGETGFFTKEMLQNILVIFQYQSTIFRALH